MKTLEFHEIANIFPLMEGPEFEALKADIAAHGLREPVRLYQEKILDGRNRYRACRELNLDPICSSWGGKDPLAFVVSLNLHRRHLSESQRAMIAARLADRPEGRPRETAPIGAVSETEAAEQFQVARRQVQRAKSVQRNGTPKLVEAVDSGSVSIAAAAEVAELPEAEQTKVVKRGPKAVKAKAAELRRGKSRVNGELVDDPDHIAELRAAGKIAPDVVPEIAEPEPDANGAPAPEIEPEPELSDEEWLETLPARAKLDGSALRQFDVDALLYRVLEPARATFLHHARRALAVGRRKGGRGEYAYRLGRFLKTDHPRHWLVCPDPGDGGCGGSGTIGLIGQCPKCHGRGYWING